MMSKKTTNYNVWYYTLEPSYYEHSEKNYVSKDFTSRKDALSFVKEAKKLYPCQIVVTRTTKETLLELRESDNYRGNSVKKSK